MPFNLSFLFRFESLRKHLVLEGRMCILNVNSSKLLQMWANWMLSQFRNREIPYRQNVTTALNQGYNVRHAHVFHCASSFGDSLSCRTLHIWCGRCYISWGRESGDKEEGPEPIACGLRILKREETQKELQEWQMSRRLFFLVPSVHHTKQSPIMFAGPPSSKTFSMREEGWAVDTMPLTGLRLVSWDRGL